MPSLLLLADTHLPLRAKDLPSPVWEHVEAVDVLVFGHSHIPWDTHGGVRPAPAQPRLPNR